MDETLVYTCDFINSAYKLLGGMPVPFAVLLSAVLATSGWIYTSWLGRVLAKKQHTMTILVKGNFCEELNKAHEKIQQPLLDYRKDKTIDEETFNEILPELNRVLNNYEFIAAGIRLGYLDEK